MSQLRLFQETQARDAALDLLEESRASLVHYARAVAESICRRNGTVTSTEVLMVMRSTPAIADQVDDVDPRFMGAVFRKGWVRVGFQSIGSHRRPVSVWKFKTEENVKWQKTPKPQRQTQS